VGGTGPTGPGIVNGLLRRGYEVTIPHRGTHEVSFDGDVSPIHQDPNFADALPASGPGAVDRAALPGRNRTQGMIA
jgi:hypothetical protein